MFMKRMFFLFHKEDIRWFGPLLRGKKKFLGYFRRGQKTPRIPVKNGFGKIEKMFYWRVFKMGFRQNLKRGFCILHLFILSWNTNV